MDGWMGKLLSSSITAKANLTKFAERSSFQDGTQIDAVTQVQT